MNFIIANSKFKICPIPYLQTWGRIRWSSCRTLIVDDAEDHADDDNNDNVDDDDNDNDIVNYGEDHLQMMWSL